MTYLRLRILRPAVATCSGARPASGQFTRPAARAYRRRRGAFVAWRKSLFGRRLRGDERLAAGRILRLLASRRSGYHLQL